MTDFDSPQPGRPGESLRTTSDTDLLKGPSAEYFTPLEMLGGSHATHWVELIGDRYLSRVVTLGGVALVDAFGSPTHIYNYWRSHEVSETDAQVLFSDISEFTVSLARLRYNNRWVQVEDCIARSTDANSLIKDVLDADSVAVIYAPPSSYKSFVTLDLSMRICLGMKVWDRPVKQGAVCYFMGEAQRNFNRRVRAWVEFHGKDASEFSGLFNIAFSCPNLGERASIEETVSLCAENRPVLVVIDTLALALPGLDENSAQEMGIAVDGLKTIQRELGCAILAVHHSGKHSKKERGSGALRGAADTMIEIDRPQGTHLRCEVKMDKSRGSGIGTVHLDMTPHFFGPDLLDDEGFHLGSSLIPVMGVDRGHKVDTETEAERQSRKLSYVQDSD